MNIYYVFVIVFVLHKYLLILPRIGKVGCFYTYVPVTYIPIHFSIFLNFFGQNFGLKSRRHWSSFEIQRPCMSKIINGFETLEEFVSEFFIEYILKYFFLLFSPLKRFMLTIWIMSKLLIPKWHFAWKRLKEPIFSWHLPRNLWEFGLMLFLLEPKVIKNSNNYDLMFFITKVIRNIYYPQTQRRCINHRNFYF